MWDGTDWLDIVAGRRIPEHAPDEVDLEMAVHHGLTGMLAHSGGPSVEASVRPVFVRMAARQRVMRTHLRRILESLADGGVSVSVLKGPALADWAYAVPSMRTFTDLDLLVPAADVEKTLRILERYPGVGWIPPKRPKADKREVLVVDKDTGLTFSVDLHWDLFSYGQLMGGAKGAVAEAWRRALYQPDHPLGPLHLLPEEARLAFLATHAALDHRFRLILFRDLAEAARLGPDWRALQTYARRWSLSSFVYTSFLLARTWAGAAVPEDVLTGLRVRSGPQRAIERLVPSVDPVTFDGHAPHLLNLAFVTLHDRRRDRIRLALRAPAAVPHWWKRVSTEQLVERGIKSGRQTILVVLTSNRRRGAEVFGTQLASGLAERGRIVETVALSSDVSGPTVGAEALDDRPLAELGRLDVTVVRALRARIDRLRPDVVLANGSATLKYSVAALVAMRHPPALVYASIGEPNYWARRMRSRRLQHLLLSRVDSIVAVSQETGRQLVDDFDVPATKVSVAYTGVPEPYLALEHVPRADDELRILVMGALTREKQPQAAVEILANLQVPARLRVVGAGDLRDRTIEQAERLGVAGAVEFTGSVDDVREHLAWADVLLLTSRTEGLPGVVLEAAAAGVPAVAFGVGGTSEAILDGETGFVVPPQDIGAAVNRLSALAGDSATILRMGASARRYVAEHFLMAHAVDRYSAVLDDVAQARRS